MVTRCHTPPESARGGEDVDQGLQVKPQPRAPGASGNKQGWWSAMTALAFITPVAAGTWPHLSSRDGKENLFLVSG